MVRGRPAARRRLVRSNGWSRRTKSAGAEHLIAGAADACASVKAGLSEAVAAKTTAVQASQTGRNIFFIAAPCFYGATWNRRGRNSAALKILGHSGNQDQLGSTDLVPPRGRS